MRDVAAHQAVARISDACTWHIPAHSVCRFAIAIKIERPIRQEKLGAGAIKRFKIKNLDPGEHA
jgi:hypothetical protein